MKKLIYVGNLNNLCVLNLFYKYVINYDCIEMFVYMIEIYVYVCYKLLKIKYIKFLWIILV